MARQQAANWEPSVSASELPLYLAIVETLEADIRTGKLTEGQRLPPQRALAEQLQIDFTTVGRAYAEARRRGLVEGRVGQGTFVRARRRAVQMAPSGAVDLSMNLPPRIGDAGLSARMWRGIGELEGEDGLGLLLRYQEPGGSDRDRSAGAGWLGARLGDVDPQRVLVAPGAQGAMLAVASRLAAPGDYIAAEALAYPGLRSLAALLRLRPVAVAIDEGGMLPEAFEAICRNEKPKFLYCNPTLHNPTTVTLSPERRLALVDIARRHGVPILEDDAYGALPETAAIPLAALAPELVYHVAGLSKCLSPALRIAYLVAPDRRAAAWLQSSLRATASMASPLGAAIATRWIETGIAAAVLTEIRQETEARRQLALEILPKGLLATAPHAFHAWMRLPEAWTRGEFSARLRNAGIGVVGSDAFALASPPEAVRLALGAPESREALRQGLLTVADLLGGTPAMSSIVV